MATDRTPLDDRQLQRFWLLISLAVVAGALASAAGIALWIADPADGTSPEAWLGFTAAVSGLLTGALFGAAAIYAQIKNLWRFAPTWFRYLAWAILILIAVVSLVSSMARN